MSLICMSCGHTLQHRTPELEKVCFLTRSPFDSAVEREKDEFIQVLKDECKMWKAQLAALQQRLREAEAVINKVIEISSHRDDEGDFFCHECKSWNHSANDHGICTTAMLQAFLTSTPPLEETDGR